MPQADLILINGKVVSLDDGQPFCRLVAIKDGRIQALGDDGDLSLFRGPQTNIIDCGGAAVLPGLIDAHAHILAYAGRLVGVECAPPAVASIAQLQEAIRSRAREVPKGTWIRAAGYNEFYLAEKRHPTRWDLDAAAPEHPVRLMHRSYHACVLNSLALHLAGITRETSDPPGGLIERDLDTGEPTGLLYEMNDHLAKKAVPPPLSEEELVHGLKRASEEFLSLGITSVQDATASNDLDRWQVFKRGRDEGFLAPRVWMMVGAEHLNAFLAQGMAFGSGDEGLCLGGVKIVLDETAGSLYPAQEELERWVIQAQGAGFPVAVHAVEEGPVEAAALALEKALASMPRASLRHRIEHCSVCPPQLMERLRRVGAMVVTQPSFVYYSGERYLAQVPPPQQRWLYSLASLGKAGLPLAAGSDCPVVPPNPWVGMYASVTRRSQAGQLLHIDEGISVRDALRMYTVGAAYAAGEEREKGTISVGKLADLILVDRSPMDVGPEELKELKVRMAIVGGQLAWSR